MPERLRGSGLVTLTIERPPSMPPEVPPLESASLTGLFPSSDAAIRWLALCRAVEKCRASRHSIGGVYGHTSVFD
jgi:hypothetical protein